MALQRRVTSICAEYGTYIELSSRHNKLDYIDIKGMLDTKVKFVLNSDAHCVEDIANVNIAYDIVKEYGIEDRVVNLQSTAPKFRSQGK